MLAGASAAQLSARASVQAATFVAPSAGKATFLKVAEDWLGGPVTQSRPRTRHGYECIAHGKWVTPLHHVAVNRLTHRELSCWLAEMVDAGLRPATIRHQANVVRAVLREAVAQGLISKNPMASVAIPKLGKAKHYVLTEADVARLIAHLEDHDDPRWAVLVTFAAYTGARTGEIAGLRVRDLNLLKRSVRIERAVQDVGGTLGVGRPKSDNGLRTVASLPRELCDGLARLIAGLGPDDYVFGWVDAAGVSHPYRHANFARRVFSPAAAAVGLPARRTDGGVDLHTLRHFHATLCLERGMTPIQVAKRLGHEDAS